MRFEGVAAALDEVVAALQGAGAWTASPPPQEAFASDVAFFADTMPFTTWLQWVLVPRVRACLDGTDVFPTDSQVGAYAVRELDGDPDAGPLVDSLCRLDDEVRALHDDSRAVTRPPGDG